MAKEYPTFAMKTWMRRLWSVAPPNALLNATLFTPPMRALAQRIYFERKAVKTTGKSLTAPSSGETLSVAI